MNGTATIGSCHRMKNSSEGKLAVNTLDGGPGNTGGGWLQKTNVGKNVCRYSKRSVSNVNKQYKKAWSKQWPSVLNQKASPYLSTIAKTYPST